MAVPFFLKSILERMLEKDQFRLPAILQDQLARKLEASARKHLSLRIAIAPHEVITTQLDHGKMQAHLNLDVNIDKASLAKIIENTIYKKTGMQVTIQPKNLTIRDKNSAVTSAHLNADLQFDKDDILNFL